MKKIKPKPAFEEHQPESDLKGHLLMRANAIIRASSARDKYMYICTYTLKFSLFPSQMMIRHAFIACICVHGRMQQGREKHEN